MVNRKDSECFGTGVLVIVCYILERVLERVTATYRRHRHAVNISEIQTSYEEGKTAHLLIASMCENVTAW